jgi:predicted O-methyltransferase YrrM
MRANPDLPGQVFTTRWYRDHIIRWNEWFKHLVGRPNLTYLEIGMWEGGSANYIMRKILTDPTSVGIGIDPFIQEDRYPIAVKNLNISAPGRFEVIKGFSYDVIKSGGRWDKTEWVDLAYIDGDHATESVKQDATLVFPLVKVGGYVVFDDYHLSRHGCPQGVDAFVKAYADYIYVNWSAGHQLFLTKTKSLPTDKAAWPTM